METSLAPLLSLFESERTAGRALVLGVVLETAGSTYRKPGALMLIAADGNYSGLLSGGCLEGDLREHAESVRTTGEPRVISYDLRGPDDLLWGLGVGCEGAMKILLMRVAASNDWQPLAHLSSELAAHRETAVGLVVESSDDAHRAGSVILPNGIVVEPTSAARTSAANAALTNALTEAAVTRKVGWADKEVAGKVSGPDTAVTRKVGWADAGAAAIEVLARIFILPLALPPRVLLLGAGPDTLPIVDFAARLGWKVTLVDHRSAYAEPAHFPQAERVVHARPDEFAALVDLDGFTAAVVMSHHLPSDLAYLRVLALSKVPYVGLLGPAVRREKLLSDLGEDAQVLRPRLRAPVGLALGGRAPESIALAIVGEIHAFVHDARGRPFSEVE